MSEKNLGHLFLLLAVRKKYKFIYILTERTNNIVGASPPALFFYQNLLSRRTIRSVSYRNADKALNQTEI